MRAMSAVVPVQIEYGTAAADVCGTCTKCGKTAHAALDPDEGGPLTRRKVAVTTVCALLTGLCTERLPCGIAPAHEDRRVPKGLTLLAETPTGDRQPVAVDAKQKLVTVWAGVVPDAVVMVVPDSEEFAEAAAEFMVALVARGYKRVRTAKPGTAATPPASAGAVA